MSASAGGGGGGAGAGAAASRPAGGMVGDPVVLAAVERMRLRQLEKGGAVSERVAAGGNVDAPAVAAAKAVVGPRYFDTFINWASFAASYPATAWAMVSSRIRPVPVEFNPIQAVWYKESPQIQKLQKLVLEPALQELVNLRINAGMESATAQLDLFMAFLKYNAAYGAAPITENEYPVIRARTLRLVCEVIDVNKKDLAKQNAQVALEQAMLAYSVPRNAEAAPNASQAQTNYYTGTFATILSLGATQTVDLMPPHVREGVKVILQEQLADGDESFPLVMQEEPVLFGPLKGATNLAQIIGVVFNLENLRAGASALLPGIKRADGNQYMFDARAQKVAEAFTAQLCRRAVAADPGLVVPDALVDAGSVASDAVAGAGDERGAAGGEGGGAGAAGGEGGGAGAAGGEGGGAGAAGGEGGEGVRKRPRSDPAPYDGGGYRKTRRNKKNRKTRSKNRKSKNKSRSKGRKSRSSRV